MTEFDDLPLEVMIIIFRKVDSISQKRTQRVCKTWYSILTANPFTKELLLCMGIKDFFLFDYILNGRLPQDYKILWKVGLLTKKLITDQITKHVVIFDSTSKGSCLDCVHQFSSCLNISPLVSEDGLKRLMKLLVPKEYINSVVLINVTLAFDVWIRRIKCYYGRKEFKLKLIECRIDVHYLIHPNSESPLLYPVRSPRNIELFTIKQADFEAEQLNLSAESVVQVLGESLAPLTIEQKNDICAFRKAIPGPVKNILPWETHEYNAIHKHLEESGMRGRDFDEFPRFIQELLHRITGKNAVYTMPPGIRIQVPDLWTDVNLLALAGKKLFGRRESSSTSIRSHSVQFANKDV